MLREKKQVIIKAWLMVLDSLGILEYVAKHNVSIPTALADIIKAYNNNCKLIKDVIDSEDSENTSPDARGDATDAPQCTDIDKPSTDIENATVTAPRRSERTKCSADNPILSDEQIKGGLTDDMRTNYCDEVNGRSKTYKIEEGGKKPRTYLDSEKGNSHYAKKQYAVACRMNEIYKEYFGACYACTITNGEIAEDSEINEVNKRFADNVKHFFSRLSKKYGAKFIRVYEAQQNGKLHIHAIFYTKDWIAPEEKDFSNNTPAVGSIAQFFADYAMPLGNYSVNVCKDDSAFQYLMKGYKYNTGNYKHILESGTDEQKAEARKAIDTYILTSNIGERQMVTSGRKGLQNLQKMEPVEKLTKSPEEGTEDTGAELIKSPKKADFDIVKDFVEGKCTLDDVIMPLIRCIKVEFKPCTRVIYVNIGNNEMPEEYKYRPKGDGLIAKMKSRYITIPQERGCEGCPVRDWYLSLVKLAKEKGLWEE